jgi:hypothetical protein
VNEQSKNTTITSNLPKVLTKGCGCSTVFFLVLFIWGIWSTMTSYSSLVEVVGTVTDIVEEDNVFMDARYKVNAFPVVTYNYQGNQYIDTLYYKANDDKILEIGSITSVLINPDQPQFSVEDSSSTYYFYFIFLFLALVSYGVYRLIKHYGIKPSTKSPVSRVRFSKPIVQDTISTTPNKFADKYQGNSTKVPSNQNILYAKPWLTISIALILIAVGIGMGYNKFSRVQTARLLNEKGVQIKGIVTKVIRSRLSQNTNRRDYYTITYTYEGATYNYETYSKFSHYNMNEELVLKINPDKPSQAMLLSNEDINRGSYLFAVFLIVMGVLIINYHRKNLQLNRSKI